MENIINIVILLLSPATVDNNQLSDTISDNGNNIIISESVDSSSTEDEKDLPLPECEFNPNEGISWYEWNQEVFGDCLNRERIRNTDYTVSKILCYKTKRSGVIHSCSSYKSYYSETFGKWISECAEWTPAIPPKNPEE